MQKPIPNEKLVHLQLAILILAVVTVLSVYAATWSAKAREADSGLANGTVTNPVNHLSLVQESRELTALVFAVRATGFDPDQFAVPAGRYLIVVQNRSGRRDLTFRFARENGEEIAQVRHERLNWKRQFDLQPGNYVLSEAAHPEWRCVIRVTSR